MLFHYQVRNYFLYCPFVDMRKGINALSGIVRNELRKNPLSGDLFIFLNKRRNQIKMLHFQGDGFAVFYKRLEKGCYEMPLNGELNHTLLSPEQLLYILQGVKLQSIRKHKRYEHHFVSK